MKKTLMAAGLGTALLVASPLETRAGDHGWCTAGAVLAGVAAGALIASTAQGQVVCAPPPTPPVWAPPPAPVYYAPLPVYYVPAVPVVIDRPPGRCGGYGHGGCWVRRPLHHGHGG